MFTDALEHLHTARAYHDDAKELADERMYRRACFLAEFSLRRLEKVDRVCANYPGEPDYENLVIWADGLRGTLESEHAAWKKLAKYESEWYV